MQSESNSSLLAALLVTLRPIARLLLKAGIGFREFSEIAKCAFVDVSTADYGLRGRPTNISRVAVMTGLTRKEVKRIREKIEDGHETRVAKHAPYIAILDQWHVDPEYLDDNSRPKKLPFEGQFGSFSSLVKKYGGDIPPGAMRTELKRVGAISEEKDGSLAGLMRAFLPIDSERRMEIIFGQALCALGNTLAHNFDLSVEEGFVQRQAFTSDIRRSDIGRVRRIAKDRVAEFTESINDLFAAYATFYPESKSDNESDNVITVGVGTYYFELTEDDTHFFEAKPSKLSNAKSNI